MSTCSCIYCRKEYSPFGIDTHYLRSHGSEQDKLVFSRAAITNKNKSKDLKAAYAAAPKHCAECNLPLPYEQKRYKFCSHNCSAKHANQKRKESGFTMSDSAKKRISEKLSIIVGPYTKVRFSPCKFCNSITLFLSRHRVCDKCQHLKWSNNKDQYSFRFNVFDYPELFDLENLKSKGWVSFGGKRGGKKNIDGLSRDHKVSVHEAKINKYDPYYISHPLNCELMPHHKNNKKKSKSSITYHELVRLVNEFDSSNLRPLGDGHT